MPLPGPRIQQRHDRARTVPRGGDRPAAREHPFMRSTYQNGFWVMTGAELIRDALQHPETFSSSVVTVHDSNPPYKWIPEMLDPPEHTVWRQLLAPHFAPRAMERLEDKVRRRCVEVIGEFAGSGHCDFFRDFAWRYPTTIFMELDGTPARRVGAVPQLGAPDPPPHGGRRSRPGAGHRGDVGGHGLLHRADRGEEGEPLRRPALRARSTGRSRGSPSRSRTCSRGAC